jgi:uncharacterized protein YdeI (YjbR/CyaY-like superfamily)
MDSKVDGFFDRAKSWATEMKALRSVLLETGLTEDLKWGKPCYTSAGQNIAIIQPMKPHLALMFFKGVLLDDLDNVLRPQGPNHQSAMRMVFTSLEDVEKGEPALRDLVEQAIDVEKKGLKVARKISFDLPAELEEALANDSELSTAFDALTPGRQRGYALFIGQAKQPATRRTRIEKYRDRIFAGKGYQDR